MATEKTSYIMSKREFPVGLAPNISLSYPLFFPMASATNSSFSHQISIFKRVWVSFRTMCFVKILSCYSNSSKDILATTNNFHMGRIDTSPIPAKMVDGHIRWNFTHYQFIGKSVSRNHSLNARKIEISISTSRSSSQPYPAISFPSFVNFRPKSNNGVRGQKPSRNSIFHSLKYSTRDYYMSTGSM